MAIIAGQTPTPHARRYAARRRVVVKMTDAAAKISAFSETDAEDTAAAALGEMWKDVEQQFPGVNIAPYFRVPAPQPPTAGVDKASAASALPSSGRYVAIEVPPGAEPKEVADMVRNSPHVDIAYPEAGPTPPPVDPSDDPRSANQGYLDEAPGGIDARWAWANAGADGSGVGFVDIEQGWTLEHEDLQPPISLISGLNLDYPGHGTAVLGEVRASDNSIGCIGIAPRTVARVVSQWRSEDAYGTAEAILSAAAAMEPCDVLLIEAQTTYLTVEGFLPVEVEEVVFDAIRSATDAGIVVIEAAGNGGLAGGIDLDEFQDFNGRQILNRNSADFRDSGAILVGAGSSEAPHRRLAFSNFGTRVDCFGWGENVDTCGDGWEGTLRNSYTSTFGGTSGASPIVTGAALLLQSWRAKIGEARFDPQAIRELLSNSELNTNSESPADDRIGVMPNLRAIIETKIAKLPAPAPLAAEA